MVSRQRRGGSHLGATPREEHPDNIVRPERAEGSCTLQGAGRSLDAGTQGVALGYHASALSAPGDVDSIPEAGQGFIP
jgi:hypothetical protein